MADVDFIPVGMGVCPTSMAYFRSSCDGQGGDSYGVLEGYYSVDSAREDTVIGSAGGNGPVRAAP